MSVYVKRLFPYFSRNGSVLCRNIKVGSERYGLEGQSVLRCAATVKSPPPKPSSWRRYGKLVGMGFGVGALATGVYMYDIYKRVTTPIANPSEGGEYVLREAPPSFTPSRRIQQLKDSTMIISVLQSFLDNNTSNLPDLVKCYPTMVYTDEEGEKRIEIMNRYFLMYGQHPSGRTKEDIVEERKWRKWVDDVFVHVLSPNVYRTTKEAFQAFEWFSKVGDWEEHFATWERLLVVYVGAVAMFLIGKNLKRRHQLKDDVRCSFYEETNVWLKALKKKGTKFMGGDQPNLSDLAVYGILTAVEGCDAFQDLKNNTKITPWFERMKEVVIQHGGATSTGEKGSAA
ncbi:prostaglandin E synthase 2-like isoform X3 [Homarus americanus]|uniref:prostaglandin E synthase 2-like isoform X3 n=1 Tax=Homarus americanus TaxID=6706 RepID=UPI001C45DB71|nr:prostaglandin E synthase 2-like isoform X3 [Homarus americanus]